MSSSFVVSLSPHVRTKSSIAAIMWTVVIAMVPALLAGLWMFGISAALVVAVATGVAVVTEWLITRYMLKQPSRISDGSAVITGMLLGMNIPAGTPLWQVASGAIFAIAIGKMAFGGLGHNPFNPALVGRAFMLTSFPADLTAWPAPGVHRWTLLQFGGAARAAEALGNDAVSGATALGMVGEAVAHPEGLAGVGPMFTHLDLFLGTIPGSIGEISALAILVGGLFMVWKKIILWESPVFFLGGLALFTGIFWVIDPSRYADPLYHLLAGGAMLAAWFMVTDMVSTPMTQRGRMIFAGTAGLLTGAIRIFGGFPEGASYAILIMNAFVPIIDRYVKPQKFGTQPASTQLTKPTKEAPRG
jgi:electron transport complex protein RnfD